MFDHRQCKGLNDQAGQQLQLNVWSWSGENQPIVLRRRPQFCDDFGNGDVVALAILCRQQSPPDAAILRSLGQVLQFGQTDLPGVSWQQRIDINRGSTDVMPIEYLESTRLAKSS